MNLPESVLVVGAGCFGLSTGYHLLQRGFKDVTIVDRSPTIPAPDAASNDINRIVRTSYDDEFYTKLAREAIQFWKSEQDWGDCYRECVLVVAGAQSKYVQDAYRHDKNIQARLNLLANPQAIRECFPSEINVGSLHDLTGYINQDGGWANASKGTQLMVSKFLALGGKLHAGKTVNALIRRLEDGCTAGVQCVDGTEYRADIVVLATGSWTASSFPELGLQRQCLATGHSIAMIQLTDEEARPYRQCPVVLDFSTGFYVFPPNDDNIVKLAIHSIGVTNNPTSGLAISVPRTISSHPEDGLRIPRTEVRSLRHHLRRFYPDLACKPFGGTRLCWYSDSPDGDWVIGFHPADQTLMLATGDSGHAYKFLPVIGRLVCDAMIGTLEQRVATKFAVGRNYESSDRSRPYRSPPELDPEQLCTPIDLQPDKDDSDL